MRTSRRVKQKMYVSKTKPGEPIYERDESGNIKYDVMPDGERVPRLIGETPEGYTEPIEFYNSISGELTEDELQAFGTESRAMAKMTYRKEDHEFGVGDVIWKESEIRRKEDESVDETSADYRVIGIQNTGRYYFKALLEAIV